MTNDATNAKELFYFNGIDGETGQYALPPMTLEELTKLIKGDKEEPENRGDLQERHSQEEKHMGVRAGIDATELAEAGWGVIFAENDPQVPEIKKVLKELLDLRQQKAGERFKVFEGDKGYKTGESKSFFLARQGAVPGPADPKKGVPYYLLIVGSPEAIPYEFQYQLDVQYAVGRIHFDSMDDYEQYARSVVAAETPGKVKLPRQASFFGVTNDRATQVSTEYLVEPLIQWLKDNTTDWEINGFLGEQATKNQLGRLLGGEQTPAMLFTASHGKQFMKGHPRQTLHQGALVCQDWPGLGHITRDSFFAGEDLTQESNLVGSLIFCFACYGAGTPLHDGFSRKEPQPIADRPFVAALPKKLLSHGALAMIGHVDQAWSYSFRWKKELGEEESARIQTTAHFEDMLIYLLDGHPVGSALEPFGQRYADLSSELHADRNKIKVLAELSPEIVYRWMANNDARSYVIIGDPAVRLPVVEPGEAPSERPVIEVKPMAASPPAPPQAIDEAPPTSDDTLFDAAEVDYGLRETGDAIARSLRDISGKLADTLATAVADLTSLEVLTYTSDDLKVNYDSKTHKPSAEARLRAITCIELDGDLLNLVPERRRMTWEGDEARTEVEIDEQLWTIHREMVDLAQANKIAFVKALAEIAGTLLKTLK